MVFGQHTFPEMASFVETTSGPPSAPADNSALSRVASKVAEGEVCGQVMCWNPRRVHRGAVGSSQLDHFLPFSADNSVHLCRFCAAAFAPKAVTTISDDPSALYPLSVVNGHPLSNSNQKKNRKKNLTTNFLNG